MDHNGERNCVVEGHDFHMNFELLLAKGGFGAVYDTWLVTKNHEARVAVKKVSK